MEEFKYLKLLLEMPVIIFNAFLFIRFAFMAIFYTWKKFRRPREEVGLALIHFLKLASNMDNKING